MSKGQLLLLLGALCAPVQVESQIENDPRDLSSRWVGMKSNAPTIGFWIEFRNDSTLVIDDSMSVTYRITEDSLITVGDTTVRASWEVVLDRWLLYTPQGLVITMAPQDPLARPLDGLWRGELGVEAGDSAEIRMFRNGNALWRRLPGGEWATGEWDRTQRIITFTWEADSTEWTGFYDPLGNALQFVNTVEGSGSVIFRKQFR